MKNIEELIKDVIGKGYSLEVTGTGLGWLEIKATSHLTCKTHGVTVAPIEKIEIRLATLIANLS